jgi:arginyl-tRNA synthetase
MQDIVEVLKAAVKDLFNTEIEPELTRPDEQFGDFATNIALQLGGKLHKNPREIAVALASKLHGQENIAEVSIAGPGFINLKLTDRALLKNLESKSAKIYEGKNVVVEYSDPNPFKVLHVGHLYTTVVGDAIANLLENAGANVHRVNFGGDVGRHVAQTLWSILHEFGGEKPEKLTDVPEGQRAEWLAENYIKGTKALEENEEAKAQITELNKRVYQLHADNDHDSPLAQIYWTCRRWSYESFDTFYERLGTKLEKYYPESEVADLGLSIVKEHTRNASENKTGPDVFFYSEAAGSEKTIIFPGDKYGLHTRVFVNKEGLPTYEAKDVGLIIKKEQDYHFDKSVVITGNEQQQYMTVVLKAIEQFLPELAKNTLYIPHGMVKLAGGVKMSSRKGNIIRATEVLDMTADAIKESEREPKDTAILGAIKYAFLKNRIGGDMVYDPRESVVLEGNSGPYLQYAHARAQNILAKAGDAKAAKDEELDEGERSLARKLSEYPETVGKATAELMPHHVATYLYELSQVFNRFYEKSRVIDDPREALRLMLVRRYAETLKSGLALLGITAPDKM